MALILVLKLEHIFRAIFVKTVPVVFIWMGVLPLSILMEVLAVRTLNEQSGRSPGKNYCGGLHPSTMKTKANWLHMVFSLVMYKCFCPSER